MRALITGGTGFVGANLAAYLRQQGWTVRILRRATSSLKAVEDLDVEHAIGDVLEPESLRPAMVGCEVVFHTAAVSAYWRTPGEQILRVNIEGTRNVLAVAREMNIRRVVLTSSLAALGVPADGTLLTEDHPLQPAAGTLPLRIQQGDGRGHRPGLRRPGAGRGHREPLRHPGPSRPPPHLREPDPGDGPGTCARPPPRRVNVVAVEDVARGHLLALQYGRPGERYILGGENLTYRDLAQQIAEVVGVPAPSRVLPRRIVKALAEAARLAAALGLPLPVGPDQLWLSAHFIWCDGRKAEAELGYRPEIPVREAIRRAWEWYQAHGEGHSRASPALRS
jgi:dihydroflavonol-4-reductase